MTRRGLVPIRGAYEALGVDRSVGARMIDRGEFPIHVIRVGRLNKIDPDELESFLAGGGGGSPSTLVAPTGPTSPRLAAALAALEAAEVTLAAARAVLEATAA